MSDDDVTVLPWLPSNIFLVVSIIWFSYTDKCTSKCSDFQKNFYLKFKENNENDMTLLTWHCCCTHPKVRMEMTRVAFKINDFLWNPHFSVLKKRGKILFWSWSDWVWVFKVMGNKLSNAPDCLMKTIIKCTEFTIILSKDQNRIRLIEWTKQIVRTKLVEG